MRTLSLRARLTVWSVVTLLVVVGAFGIDLLVAQNRLGMRRVDRELDSVDATLANVFAEELDEVGDPAAAAREAMSAIASLGGASAILDARGAPLASQLSTLHAGNIGGAARVRTVSTIETPSGPWRVHTRPATFKGATATLVVARPLTDLARDQGEVVEAMLLVIPIALLLAGAGGWWLASVGLRPVREMAQRAGRIPPSGLEDLGHPLRDDELGQLAVAFNGLVARLRAALQTQQQFMADASHELRTPVSIIRTAAEVTLNRTHRDEIEYREALAMTRAQAQRLGTLVEDMLVLARADAGAYPLRVVDIYLDDIVEECRQGVGMLAEQRGVSVTASSPTDVPLRGDEELLRRLLLNLLHNALQHSPAGGTVCIEVTASPQHACVRVHDSGPGIPEADRVRIFDRFVQLDASRRSEGTGLGLTIARWIAEAHDGSLILESSSPEGSTFCATLPLAGSFRPFIVHS